MNMVVSTFAKPFRLVRSVSLPRRLADGVSHPPWSWRSAVAAVAISFAAYWALPELIYALWDRYDPDTLFSDVIWSIPLFLCLKHLARHGGTTVRKAFGLSGAPFGRVLRSGIVLFILESLLGFVASALLLALLFSLKIDPGTAPDYPTSLIFILDDSVLTPICEELLFRALLYTSLRTRLGVAPSVLITAAAFACWHIPTSLDHITNLFVSAILSSIWYERTRCLWPNIISHSLYNTLSTVLQLSG